MIISDNFRSLYDWCVEKGLSHLYDFICPYYMDAYSGYNEIKIYPLDEDKTTFITGWGIFCYKVIPFGMKNVGATFQWMVDRVFKDLIGHTMKVYVDDMLMESISDISTT